MNLINTIGSRAKINSTGTVWVQWSSCAPSLKSPSLGRQVAKYIHLFHADLDPSLGYRYYTRLLWKPRTALAVAYLLHEPDVQVQSAGTALLFIPKESNCRSTNPREQMSHARFARSIVYPILGYPWWPSILYD